MSIKNDYDIPNYGEIKGIVGEIFHGEREDDYESQELVVMGSGGLDEWSENQFKTCYTGNSITPFYLTGNTSTRPYVGITFDYDYLQMAYINNMNTTFTTGGTYIAIRVVRDGEERFREVYTFHPLSAHLLSR